VKIFGVSVELEQFPASSHTVSREKIYSLQPLLLLLLSTSRISQVIVQVVVLSPEPIAGVLQEIFIGFQFNFQVAFVIGASFGQTLIVKLYG
jgi:hypothetical protein